MKLLPNYYCTATSEHIGKLIEMGILLPTDISSFRNEEIVKFSPTASVQIEYDHEYDDWFLVTTYPRQLKSTFSGIIVEFTSANTGTAITGNHKGLMLDQWTNSEDIDLWTSL